MHSYGNTCKHILFFAGSRLQLVLWMCIGWGLATGAHASPDELVLNWRFPDDTPLVYSVRQSTQIQHYRNNDNSEDLSKSPIHIESVTGEFTLTRLPDGNAACDLVLKLESIRDEDNELILPPEQKIPQRVIRFILTPSGAMEDFIGTRKETYLLTRLIFGLPIQGLKQNQLRVYPFRMFTQADNSRAAFNGNISHELKSIESTETRQSACIITTIDLNDVSGDEGVTRSLWKGLATSFFDLNNNRLDKTTMKIAVKKRFSPQNESGIIQTVEIFSVDIELKAGISLNK